MGKIYYISVLLPLRLNWLPIYSSTSPIERGQVVRLIFSNKEYYAVVWDILSEEKAKAMLPGNSTIHEILSSQCGIPSVSEFELQLWDFIASYYLCSIGEVYKAARPKQNWNSEKASVSRLERLNKKLSSLELALSKRHRSDISDRLIAEKSAVCKQIEIFAKAQHSFSQQDQHSFSQEDQHSLSQEAQHSFSQEAQHSLSQQDQYSPAATPQSQSRQRVQPITTKIAPKPILLMGSKLATRYISEAEQEIQKGRQVLILCPEIAYCSKLEKLLKDKFDELVLTVNSQVSAANKREAASCLRRGEPCIILGTRSSIFLPFSNLSLIIIDNEQESSYKQSEPAPRYNARDVASWIANYFGARIILSSASPSFESLYNANCGKYSIEQVESNIVPNWQVIDISIEKKKNGMIAEFSRKLLEQLRIWEGEIILIRGYEKRENIEARCQELLGSKKDIQILTLREFKQKTTSNQALVAILQADAYISKEDFRSDERSLQMLHSLSSLVGKLIIQTAVASRFDGSRSVELLMQERQQFAFPPYTRLVNIHSKADGQIIQQYFLAKDNNLAANKAQIMKQLEKDFYADVDPLA